METPSVPQTQFHAVTGNKIMDSSRHSQAARNASPFKVNMLVIMVNISSMAQPILHIISEKKGRGAHLSSQQSFSSDGCDTLAMARPFTVPKDKPKRFPKLTGLVLTSTAMALKLVVLGSGSVEEIGVKVVVPVEVPKVYCTMVPDPTD